MSGSDKSNEDLVAGRVNRFNDTTTFWAQDFPGDGLFDIEPWQGDAMLRVGWAPDQVPSWAPDRERRVPPIDGIVGTGEADSPDAATGVVGLGSRRGGTGVIGCAGRPHGSGLPTDDPYAEADEPYRQLESLRRSTEGTGVYGVGRYSYPTGGHLPTPGTGVVGIGGGIVDPASPIGAGVAGYAGFSDQTVPKSADSLNCGVYGSGPAGVVGMGYVSNRTGFLGPPPTGVRGSAVSGIGVRGEVKSGTGISGESEHGDGVRGTSNSAAGVEGYSDKGRGGVFGSGHVAQLSLVPAPTNGAAFDTRPVTPNAVVVEGQRVRLPADGRPGDLMMLSDGDSTTLWLCVKGPVPSTRARRKIPATWSQVLLGTPFHGAL